MDIEKPVVIQDFFGVYLLYCINPKYKGRTYIGYTRDPTRRIKQHNRGTWAGGAYRTSNKGPWKMVLIVHGFPNNIAALRFEWAWQNPNTTTRLQHLYLKKIPRKESEFQFQLRVLNEMLHVGPWLRLPLTLQWLEREFCSEFSSLTSPPPHVPTLQGAVKSKNLKKTPIEQIQTECLICSQNIAYSNTKLTCLNVNCELVCHLTCLSDLFLEPGELVPIQGTCPFCDTYMKWGDLIRKMRGCTTNVVCDNGDSDVEDDPSSQRMGFVDNNSRWLDE